MIVVGIPLQLLQIELQKLILCPEIPLYYKYVSTFTHTDKIPSRNSIAVWCKGFHSMNAAMGLLLEVGLLCFWNISTLNVWNDFGEQIPAIRFQVLMLRQDENFRISMVYPAMLQINRIMVYCSHISQCTMKNVWL